MAREKVNEILKELCKMTENEELVLDEHGICALDYEEDLRIVLEVPDESELLYVYSQISEVNIEDEKEMRETYAGLLKLNLLGFMTRGASYGISGDGKDVVMSYTHSIANLDVERLANILSNFIDLLLDQRKRHFKKVEDGYQFLC